MINLISDTVTKPSAEMLKFMAAAEVGDDVFHEDPSVNALEERVAKMFGKQAAVFCPSGTMTNQIAIKVHTNPLDELICDHHSHVYQYEAGGYAFNSGISIKLIEGHHGKITADQIESVIQPNYEWLPSSRLVVIENSCNKGGGNYYTLEELKPIHDLCVQKNLKLHLDGARLFNVLVETNESTLDIGRLFDTVSICLSKGLGAPVGSLLIGSTDDINMARRVRKVMGGGMRQAVYLAAGGTFALGHHIEDLKIDNRRAGEIGELLITLPYVESILPVRTNIIIFKLSEERNATQFVEMLKEKNINAAAFGPHQVRFVFHRDISADDFERLNKILREIK